MSEVLSGRSPWLWLAALAAMLIALLVGIFQDDDNLGQFSEFDTLARSSALEDGGNADISPGLQNAIDRIIGDALNGSLDLDDYEPPNVGSDVDPEEIRVTRGTDLVDTLSIQQMLDGDGYDSTTVALVAEGGREREGILLEDLLERAGIDDWSTVILTGYTGQSTLVSSQSWEAAPDQFLLYWSSDGNPSPTLSFTDPTSSVRLIDVVQIAIVD